VHGFISRPPAALAQPPAEDASSSAGASGGVAAAFRILPPVLRVASGIAGAAAAAQSLGRSAVESGVRSVRGLSGRMNLEAGLNLLLLRHPQTPVAGGEGAGAVPVPLVRFGGGPGSPVLGPPSSTGSSSRNGWQQQQQQQQPVPQSPAASSSRHFKP